MCGLAHVQERKRRVSWAFFLIDCRHCSAGRQGPTEHRRGENPPSNSGEGFRRFHTFERDKMLSLPVNDGLGSARSVCKCGSQCCSVTEMPLRMFRAELPVEEEVRNQQRSRQATETSKSRRLLRSYFEGRRCRATETSKTQRQCSFCLARPSQ